MSKQSERVKAWRRNCKRRIVEAMGGACCICNYKKCDSALALHHLDPSKKDIGLGAIRANPKNWLSIVEELRKCVLVCHNCHSEIHAGLIQVPNNAPKFNEIYTNYKLLEVNTEIVFTPCPVCGKLKRPQLVNCSRECNGKSKYKIDWDNINLQDALKNKTVSKLAEELGCSDAAIHKKMTKLGLKK